VKDPKVKDILAPFVVEQAMAELKGVQQQMPVFRVKAVNMLAV
jgi:hypothetical protein